MRRATSNTADSLFGVVARVVLAGCFGFFALSAHAATISGKAFVDTDGDGDSTGEPGRNDVSVKLWDAGTDGISGTADDQLVSSDVTGGTGLYSFAGVGNGTFYVVFTAPDGTIFTGKDQAADDVDSDVDAAGWTDDIVISGPDVPNVDAGVLTPSTVGDYVWEDADADGIQDAGESGLSGVTVTLYQAGPVQIAQTTTDPNGAFTFTDLIAGTYFIEVTVPTGYSVSPKQEGADTEVDSDIDTVTAQTDDFTLAVGEEDLTIDAGLYAEADVAGWVFVDADGDGIQDPGESGEDNVTVRLFDPGDDWAVGGAGGAADTEVANTTTDPNGNYTFADQTPGPYYVEFTAPGGTDFSPPDLGNDDTLDSDADRTSGCSHVFRLMSGTDVDDVDAGVAEFVPIGNFVFFDNDGDGVQDGGESGVKDVLVLAYAPGDDGEAGGADDVLLGQTLTDNTGAWALALVPAEYYLRFVPPPGYTWTLQDQGGDDNTDSDAATTTGLTSLFTVSSGTPDNSRDAGLLADSDGDGTADGDDGCPDDWYKTSPGQCGCGSSDIDSDEDGVADCVDNCPQIVNPAQADSDGDGIGNACEESAEDDSSETKDDDNSSTADTGTGASDGSGDAGVGGNPQTEIQNLLANCGSCGPVGLVSYSLCLLGYGAFLTWRRR